MSERQEVVEEILSIVPSEFIVRCREGGGEEDSEATLGLSVARMADAARRASEAQAMLRELLDPDMPEDLPGAVRYMIDHSGELAKMLSESVHSSNRLGQALAGLIAAAGAQLDPAILRAREALDDWRASSNG